MTESKNTNKDKFRLSCSLYELVEIWSMRNTVVDIEYIDQDESVQSYHGLITNVYSRDGVEQVELDNKLNLLTQKLISVNGVSFQNYMQ